MGQGEGSVSRDRKNTAKGVGENLLGVKKALEEVEHLVSIMTKIVVVMAQASET